MISITIDSIEAFEEATQQFVYIKGQTIVLEHSLVSLAKWESKWKKPFLSKVEKTQQETLDYIRCMTITQNVDPILYNFISSQQIKEISKYIEDDMTATTFSEKKKGGGGPLITAELIYYWMISLNIPFECQKWHLNRLLALIKVCNIKSNPGKKMSQQEILARNARINAARKEALNTKG